MFDWIFNQYILINVLNNFFIKFDYYIDIFTKNFLCIISQPCWAKPNSIVELFENPKMYIFTNSLNILNLNFDIYIWKPLDDSIIISEDSIFFKYKNKIIIFFTEFTETQNDEDYLIKLQNSINFLETNLIIENYNLFLINDSNNNDPDKNIIVIDYFLKLINNFILPLFLKNNIIDEIQKNNPEFYFFNLLYFFKPSFINEVYFLNYEFDFFNSQVYFFKFFKKNYWLIKEIDLLNIVNFKHAFVFFNYLIVTDCYIFYHSIKSDLFPFSKYFFPNENKSFLNDFKFTKIFFFNKYLLKNYFFNNFYIKSKIKIKFNFKININLIFKITDEFFFKIIKKKNIFLSFIFFKRYYYNYFSLKKKKYLFFDSKLINYYYFNKNLFKYFANEITWLLDFRSLFYYWFDKLLGPKIYLKFFDVLIKENIEVDYFKYMKSFIKRNEDLEERMIYFRHKPMLSSLDFLYLFKQFIFKNFRKIHFFTNEIKKKKITLNLFTKISLLKLNINNLKINYFITNVQNKNINFFKKIFFILLFIFISSILIIFYIIFFYKTFLSKKTKRKLRKFAFKKFFFHYWFIKTRFFVFKKKIFNFFTKIFYILYYIMYNVFYIIYYILYIIYTYLFKYILILLYIYNLFLNKLKLKNLFFDLLNYYNNTILNKINKYILKYYYLKYIWKKHLKKKKREKIFFYLWLRQFHKNIIDFFNIIDLFNFKNILYLLNFFSLISLKVLMFFNKEIILLNYYYLFIKQKKYNKNKISHFIFLYLILYVKNLHKIKYINLKNFNFIINVRKKKNFTFFLSARLFVKRSFIVKSGKLKFYIRDKWQKPWRKKKNFLFFKKNYLKFLKNVKYMNKSCILNTANKSNILKLKLFHIYRSGRNSKSKISFFLRTSVRELKPLKKIDFKRKKKILSLLSRTKQWILRKDGSQRKFSDNAILILKKNSLIYNKFTIGPTTIELKRKKYLSFFKYVY